MRNLHDLDKYRERSARVLALYGDFGDDRGGAFRVPSPTDGRDLCVIASNDAGWDHVSVSHPRRCPNWYEMEKVKRLFFRDDEVAFQLHLPPSDHVSLHPNCLHIWRPHGVAIPLPSVEFVAPRPAAKDSA